MRGSIILARGALIQISLRVSVHGLLTLASPLILRFLFLYGMTYSIPTLHDNIRALRAWGRSSVGSISSMGMGISPKDTVTKDPRTQNETLVDPAAKQ